MGELECLIKLRDITAIECKKIMQKNKSWRIWSQKIHGHEGAYDLR